MVGVICIAAALVFDKGEPKRSSGVESKSHHQWKHTDDSIEYAALECHIVPGGRSYFSGQHYYMEMIKVVMTNV